MTADTHPGMPQLVTHQGGCHCGRVRLEVDAPADIEALECNCSLCAMSGFLHLIVPQARFRLLSGREDLITYTFNSRIAQHHFCRVCGIKSWYVPRSNPDGIDVNVRCLDAATVGQVTVTAFDGRHWEEHAADLQILSART